MAQEIPSDALPPPKSVGRDDAEVEFSRVVAFSDGVFAIAITLLVLALEVPASASDLAEGLLDLEDDFFAYALSFAVVGKFWLSHHRFYGSLARFDGTLMGLNLFYLFWVCLLPFTSELLGTYGAEPTATIAYALNIVGASGTFLIQIRYSYRHNLLREEAKLQERRYAGPPNFIFVGIFALSIPVSLLSTTAATLMWLATFVIGNRLADWFVRREEAATG
ncbi:MAG: TMEM175 family protein [Solirubrobacterales bacterium]